MNIELIKQRARRLFARLSSDQRKQLARAIDAGDPVVLRSLMARLDHDRVQKENDAYRYFYGLSPHGDTRPKRKNSAVICPDCHTKEDEYHIPGCRHGVCPNARGGYKCSAPMRLLRRDEIPPDWVTPPPDRSGNKWFVRLPSRCDDCGGISPERSGAQ